MLCESSGGYKRLYLAVAKRLGIETALVSPEQVGRLTKPRPGRRALPRQVRQKSRAREHAATSPATSSV